ncbi:MAG: antitoxin MazE family protein [Candidatus Binatia bacterium]
MSPVSKRRSRTLKSIATRRKVQAHRKRLSAQGLRPIQIWVPDTRSPEFAAAASRQSRLVAASSQAAEDQAFIDAISTDGDE